MTFVNYAHRGASEYLPENTMLAFYTGIYMGANGIETDVQRTKDGTLVLFHDDTLMRVTGQSGSVGDYTFEELQAFDVSKNGFTDKITAFEDFLKHFSHRDITFAIELKGAGVEKDTADLLRKYGLQKKAVVTSFAFEYLRTFRQYAP
jgi:glycerophosphoryl diester phosphodiesterase